MQTPKMWHLICFGNDLHGDDGFGPEVYRQLRALTLPPGVCLYNAGVAGLNALSLFEGCERVLLIDALENQGMPGRLSLFTGVELQNISGAGEDNHGTGLPYLLRAVQATVSPLPEVYLLGAEIGRIQAFSPGLSDELEASVQQAVSKVLEMIVVEQCCGLLNDD